MLYIVKITCPKDKNQFNRLVEGNSSFEEKFVPLDWSGTTPQNFKLPTNFVLFNYDTNHSFFFLPHT